MPFMNFSKNITWEKKHKKQIKKLHHGNLLTCDRTGHKILVPKA
jgi:hypothetical protein